MKLVTYIGVLLVGVGAVFGWSRLMALEDNVVLEILAPRDPEFALPVYAQFVVTQTLVLEKSTLVKHFVVPLYFPVAEQRLQIDLLSDEELLWRWRYQPTDPGTSEAVLPFSAPQRLAGRLSMRFSADTIDHEHQAEAPRLFVESEDRQYPNGNYRIAENEKEGDVGLVVVEERQVLEKVREAWGRRPLVVVGQAGRGLLGVVLVLALPSVLLLLFRPSRSK